MRLLDAPTVITAELGGLTIKEPLESSKPRRAFGQHSDADQDLPLTEGGAGFVTQPEGVSTTTIHIFPEGKEYFKDGNPAGNPPGATVSAKVFPPKGRTLQSLTGIHLVKATDDKAAPSKRPIMLNASSFNFDGSTFSGPITLLIRFPEDLRREKINIKLKGLDLL